MNYDAYHDPDNPKRIHAVAYAAMREGKSNEEVLAVVKQEFPRGHTSLKSIQWYRSHFRKTDPMIPKTVEIRKARKAP